jgi:predicted double-glycine peptidase
MKNKTLRKISCTGILYCLCTHFATSTEISNDRSTEKIPYTQSKDIFKKNTQQEKISEIESKLNLPVIPEELELSDDKLKNEKILKALSKKIKHNVIFQIQPNACGAAALANVLTFFHHFPITEKKLLESIGSDGKNILSMQDIKNMALLQGYESTAYKVNVAGLIKLPKPLIIRTKDNEYQFNDGSIEQAPSHHFMVVEKIANGIVTLKDPQQGNRQQNIKSFIKKWSEVTGKDEGYAFFIIPKK